MLLSLLSQKQNPCVIIIIIIIIIITTTLTTIYKSVCV
jgi:hypothetical protein